MLDDKLREILSEDRPVRDENRVELIKQAFADEDKQTLLEEKAHQALNHYIRTSNPTMVDFDWDDVSGTAMAARLKYIKEHDYLPVVKITGQEWYDRFEKELDSITLHPKTPMPLALVREAAKRASGLAD